MSDTPKSEPKSETRSAADRLRESAEKARDTLSESVVEPVKRAGEAMRASSKKLVEGNAEIGLKMLDQAERNVQQAFAAMRSAAKAKDISEVMKVQAEFVREQGQRSLEQAREIGEMIVKVGTDAVTPLRPGPK